MIDLSNKVCLFFDPSAGFTHMAEAVVGEFAEVVYFSPFEQAFPSSKDYLPGTNLDGIRRAWDFWDEVDSADLVVFPDVGNAGLQEYLRRQGMPVFGSAGAEKLERDRWYLKSVCKKYGIDSAEATPITGIDNLRAFLSEQDDVHVKCSYFRGDGETFHHTNQNETRRRLDEIALKMEPYGASAQFVVEKPIDTKPCVEVGADVPWTARGIFPRVILWGFEAKDAGYAGCIGRLPDRLQETLSKLTPVLEQFNYRGALSTETRETPDGSFFLDMTARFPNPPSALMRFMISNWAEGMWEAAHGRVVEPDYNAPVGVQIICKSEYGADNPLAVEIDRLDRTVLYGHCQYGDQHYAVSPSEIAECGAAVGLGTTLSQAMEEAVEVMEGIKGREVKYDAGALEELTEAIETAEKLGINWNRPILDTEAA
jgi:phosphoribosylamine-glycine ligase